VKKFKTILSFIFAISYTLHAVGSSAAEAISSQSMRAVQIQEFGGPEVLTIHELPIPSPGQDELLVQVHAAGINPVDTGVRSGRAAALAAAVPPYVPGFDISGTVAAVGSGITNFKIGDEVFAMLDLRRGGGYAEFAIVKEDEAAIKPTNISFSEAASVPLVTLTAWQVLFEVGNLQAGQTVLIHAGAGGVGSVAVQLAKWRGANVIATASDYNHDFLRELGVDVPVDYRTQQFEDFASDIDLVLDTIGGDTQIRSMTTLKEGGKLVSIVGLTAEGRNPARNIEVTSILVRPEANQLLAIGELIEDGILNPILSYQFPLTEAPAAHEQSETRRTRGKIVLEMNNQD
jgi:NADPH:quinone reductase-like Zn-dependent oxidoreductase